MGNTLATMQRELVIANSDSARDAQETLDRLEDMAQDRVDLFYQTIGHDDLDKHLIPINKVLNKYTYIGVVTEQEKASWNVEVSEAVKEFSTGVIAEGLSSVATNTIFKMIRSSAGRRQFQQRYAISMDSLGGISRLDYFIFTYTFCSTELAKKQASLVACCVVESSAVVEGLDPNTLRVIVSRAFRGGDVPISTLTAIYAQLTTAIAQPTSGFALTEKEKESLENWYSKSNQKLLTHGGDDTPPKSESSSPVEGGFSQGGFQPAEVEVRA